MNPCSDQRLLEVRITEAAIMAAVMRGASSAPDGVSWLRDLETSVGGEP
jgi:hypothetical protein